MYFAKLLYLRFFFNYYYFTLNVRTKPAGIALSAGLAPINLVDIYFPHFASPAATLSIPPTPSVLNLTPPKIDSYILVCHFSSTLSTND